MDTTLQISIVVLIGVFLLYLVRVSSEAYKEKHGQRSLAQKIITILIYLAWCALIFIGVWFHPLAGIVIFLAYFVGLIPLAKGKPNLWRDIRDTGFIAVFSALPLSYFVFYYQ